MSRFLRLLTPLIGGALVLAACAAQPAVVPTAAPAVAPTVAPTTAATEVPAPVTSDPITGAPALARGAVSEHPFVVMIDNHPNAFPQTGLDKAAVVFEALAEFGLTRYMAVYAPGITPEAPEVGPVRSARLYFVQWAMGFGGLYVHAGGSPQALELAEATDVIVNVDALLRVSGSYFRRSTNRDAPHNLFTSTTDLESAAEKLAPPDFSRSDVGFLFKEDAPVSARPASQELSYFFLYKEDDAGWTYDQDTNSYLRLRRGKAVRDALTGEQLRVKNVVVLEVQEAPIPGDPKGRIEQQVIGSGKARVFMDGIEREVSWRKDSAEAPLLILEASGEEVRFNPGAIWITAIPSLENLTAE
ncbi:MAG: hypothetical protein RLZZ387_4410 [Chloroflexota bacterium]